MTIPGESQGKGHALSARLSRSPRAGNYSLRSSDSYQPFVTGEPSEHHSCPVSSVHQAQHSLSAPSAPEKQDVDPIVGIVQVSVHNRQFIPA